MKHVNPVILVAAAMFTATANAILSANNVFKGHAWVGWSFYGIAAALLIWAAIAFLISRKQEAGPARMKVTPHELQRTLRLHGKVGGRHIFLRAKVELLEPMHVTVIKYRMELSRGGALDAPEFQRDIDRWEITDWSQDPIPHEEMRPLPMELNCGEPVEGWVHFVTGRSDRELDRSLVRLFVHTSQGTGYAEIPAGPEYWNPIKNKMVAEK